MYEKACYSKTIFFYGFMSNRVGWGSLALIFYFTVFFFLLHINSGMHRCYLLFMSVGLWKICRRFCVCVCGKNVLCVSNVGNIIRGWYFEDELSLSKRWEINWLTQLSHNERQLEKPNMENIMELKLIISTFHVLAH